VGGVCLSAVSPHEVRRLLPHKDISLSWVYRQSKRHAYAPVPGDAIVPLADHLQVPGEEGREVRDRHFHPAEFAATEHTLRIEAEGWDA